MQCRAMMAYNNHFAIYAAYRAKVAARVSNSLSLLSIQNDSGFTASTIQLNEQAERKRFRACD
jgi:hypothetical protein